MPANSRASFASSSAKRRRRVSSFLASVSDAICRRKCSMLSRATYISMERVRRSCWRCEAYRMARDLVNATKTGGRIAGHAATARTETDHAFLRGMTTLPLGGAREAATALLRKDRNLPIPRYGRPIRWGETCARRLTGPCTNQCLLGCIRSPKLSFGCRPVSRVELSSALFSSWSVVAGRGDGNGALGI